MGEFLSERANPSRFLERRPGVDKVNPNHLLEKLPQRASTTTNTYAKASPVVYLDLTIGKEAAGRIVIKLFSEICPRTCENFRCLCTGEKQNARGRRLAYEGSVFHRVVPGFIIQGGDITKHNGTSGESIYGDRFADENFTVRHSQAGLVSMANAGPDTNNSQFFITLAPCPHLDRKNVVFGKVVEGMEVVRAISLLRTDKDDAPEQRVVVTRCGQLNHLRQEVTGDQREKPKSTVEEESEKEKKRREEAEGELGWFHACAKMMEKGYREKLEALEPVEQKIRQAQKRKQKVVGVGCRPDKEEEEEEARLKAEKEIVVKRRRVFF